MFSKMVTNEQFIALASGFPEVTVEPHFETISFRVNKKIFATINPPERRACVKFDVMQQDLFCSFDRAVIYPVPNKWGTHGWTNINLKQVRVSTLKDALKTAYCLTAPRKLAALVDAGESL